MRGANNRVAIVEHHGGGHRFVYAAIIARQVIEMGGDALFFVSEQARSSTAFRVHIADEFPDSQVISYGNGRSMSTVRRLAKQLQADRIVIPEGDSWLGTSMLSALLSMPSMRRVSTTLLIMRDPQLDDLNSDLKRRIRKQAKRAGIAFARSAALPGLRVLMLRDPLPEFWIPAETVPDPVAPKPDPNDIARFRDCMPDTDCFWYGIVGAISERKSPRLIVDGALRSGLAGCGLAIVGPHDLTQEAELALDEAIGRLTAGGWRTWVLDRTLTDSEVSVAIASMDCLVVAYTNPNPPSTLSKAASIGRRTIAAGPPGTLESARRLGATALVERLLPESIAEAMIEVRTAPEPAPIRLLGQAEFALAILTP